MLTKNDRILVEAIRQSPVVEIIVPGYDGKTGDCRIKVTGKLVCHDVALAVQNHLNNVGRRIVGGGGKKV